VSSSTINRNVIVKGRRTSIRLEVAEWEALQEICQSEQISTNQLCAYVADTRSEKAFTSGLRVFMLNYFRHSRNALRNGPTQAWAHDRRAEKNVAAQGLKERPARAKAG
jgi:predicted DNA-binding ribbon-helix-helix protein